MRSLYAALLFVTAIVIVASPAAAVETGDPAAGLAYVRENCADCHAVEADDFDSPMFEAPGFEEVANVPAMSELALISFFQTPHEYMPNFMIPSADVASIIAYIRSLRD